MMGKDCREVEAKARRILTNDTTNSAIAAPRSYSSAGGTKWTILLEAWTFIHPPKIY